MLVAAPGFSLATACADEAQLRYREGINGNRGYAPPHDRLREVLAEYGRLAEK